MSRETVHEKIIQNFLLIIITEPPHFYWSMFMLRKRRTTNGKQAHLGRSAKLADLCVMCRFWRDIGHWLPPKGILRGWGGEGGGGDPVVELSDATSVLVLEQLGAGGGLDIENGASSQSFAPSPSYNRV